MYIKCDISNGSKYIRKQYWYLKGSEKEWDGLIIKLNWDVKGNVNRDLNLFINNYLFSKIS